MHTQLHALDAMACCTAPWPVDEVMQPAHLCHQFAAGPVLQMVCVAQNDMAVYVQQLLRGDALDSACMGTCAWAWMRHAAVQALHGRKVCQ